MTFNGLGLTLAVQAICLLALGTALSGCGGGNTSVDTNTKKAISFTKGEPTPSSCTIGNVGSPSFGTEAIRYNAFDDPSSFLDIVAEYSTNGGVTFFPATQGIGGDGDIVVEATPNGIPSPPSPGFHVFTWDTLTDLPSSVAAPLDNVVFRITGVENSGDSGPIFGSPCTSNVFTVFNTPAILDLGSLSTGTAQVGETISIVLTNAVPSGNPTEVTLDVVYDSTLITVTGAIGGPVDPAATVDFTLISPGRVHLTVTSSGGPFADGEIITLIVDTACVAPRALPASAAIICDLPSARSILGNPVSIACGASGSTAILDNASTMEVADFMLAVGQPTEFVPLVYTNGAPSVMADRLTFTLTWDPTLIAIVGANPGVDLDPGGMVTFTGGAASGTVVIENPAGVPFIDGILADILVDTVATVSASTFISIGNSVLEARSGPCALVTGRFLSPTVQVTISDARTLMGLRAVGGLGQIGTPALIPGSDMAGNPKGNWSPLNSGDFSGGLVDIRGGGNPIVFFSAAAAPFQVVIEGVWSAPPDPSDVSAAMNIDGMTSYMTLSGSTVTVDANGLLTPVGANGCTYFQADFTPNGVTAFGVMMSVLFAACVDLGGIDGLTRSTDLPTGNLDADIPGLPLGDVPPGAGGMFTETMYLNTGPTSVGAYQVMSLWDPARIEINAGVGSMGFSGPSDIFLAGPSVVNILTPGQAIANHFTVSTAFSGVFDIWTMNFNVLTAGNTNINHSLESLVSSAVPPAPIGAPTPRAAPEASATTVTFP